MVESAKKTPKNKSKKISELHLLHVSCVSHHCLEIKPPLLNKRICIICLEKSKKLLPNGSLMVVYYGKFHKESPKNTSKKMGPI